MDVVRYYLINPIRIGRAIASNYSATAGMEAANRCLMASGLDTFMTITKKIYLNTYFPIFTVLFFLLSGCAGLGIKSSEQIAAKSHYEKGLTWDAQDNYEQAILEFDQALKLNPEYKEALNDRGLAKRKASDIPGAIQDYNAAIDIDPEFTVAYNNRGYARFHMAEFSEAIGDFNRAIELNPEYAIAYRNRGSAYRQLNKMDQALADYTKAIELDPNFGLAYASRGDLYTIKREWDKALSDYNRAIEIDPESLGALFSRATVFQARGDVESALSDYEQILSFDPNAVEALVNRGNIRADHGDPEGAMADYRKAEEIAPGSPVPFYNQAQLWLRQGRCAPAIEALEKAVAVNGQYGDALNELAWRLSTCKNADLRNGRRAVILAEQAVSLSRDPNYLDTLAAAYAETGRFDDAIAIQMETTRMFEERGNSRDAEQSTRHLRAYQAHRPWREK